MVVASIVKVFLFIGNLFELLVSTLFVTGNADDHQAEQDGGGRYGRKGESDGDGHGDGHGGNVSDVDTNGGDGDGDINTIDVDTNTGDGDTNGRDGDGVNNAGYGW